MSISVAQYIVVDYTIHNLGEYKNTVSGTVLFPIGAILPIIVSGKGCIGLAKVETCTLRETSSTVFFEVFELGDYKDYSGIYLMYQTTNGNSSNDDYDDAPAFGVPRASESKRNKNSSREGLTSRDFDRW